jgi:predicted methyltransferase
MNDRDRMSSAARRGVAFVCLAVALAGGALAAQSERERQETARDTWQKTTEIFEAMGVGPGAQVADVGAGGGYFTVRLARAVGEAGRVFAVDVDGRALDRLRGRVENERLSNVEIVRGEVDDPKLAPGSIDAALIVNAYHEMDHHKSMLEHLRRALRPGGRLVIVEPISEKSRGKDRAAQTDSHEIAAEFVRQDAIDAGFRVVGLTDPFTSRHSGGDDEWLLILAAPPAAAEPPAARVEADEQVRAPGLRIGMEELETLYAAGRVIVVDVRGAGSYRYGHIAGAISIPPEEIEARAAELRAAKKPIVTYCS